MTTSGGQRRRREKVGKTRRQDGGEEKQRKETIREVRAKMNITKISNTRDVGMGIRGNKFDTVQKCKHGEQIREEEGKRSTPPEAQGITASAKPEGRRTNPSIRAMTETAEIELTKV